MKEQRKIVEDIATLTGIAYQPLYRLVELAEDSIAHCVFENIVEQNPLTTIDLGVGILYIKCEEDEIKYKFIPSKQLEGMVSRAVENKTSPVVQDVDVMLKDKIEKAYKRLL